MTELCDNKSGRVHPSYPVDQRVSLAIRALHDCGISMPFAAEAVKPPAKSFYIKVPLHRVATIRVDYGSRADLRCQAEAC